VFTIGFPVSAVLGDEAKFTDGSVSALSGVGGEATFIQVTVPIQPGNSGGALLNDSGEVVGIVTASAAIRPFLAVAGTLPQNINWAVKAEYAAPLFDEPRRRPASQDRRAAIDHALKATCSVEVTR
jgi:S1-C subfamily serine protease